MNITTGDFVEQVMRRIESLPKFIRIALLIVSGIIFSIIAIHVLGFVFGLLASVATLVIGIGIVAWFGMHTYERFANDSESQRSREMRLKIEDKIQDTLATTSTRINDIANRISTIRK